MITSAISQQIQSLINDKKAIANRPVLRPHNSVSLKEHVLIAELKQEIIALEGMLANPDTFEQQFLERCSVRQANSNDFIGFAAYPESLSNKLYLEIATLTFQPQNLHDLLKIILPNLNRSLTVESNATEPQIIVEQLDACSKKMRPSDLKYYVIAGSSIFDVRQIQSLPFDMQSTIHDQLHQSYPEVAKALYSHNAVLRTLKEDIALTKNQGQTPRQAIRPVIRDLVLDSDLLAKKYYKKYTPKRVNKITDDFVTYWGKLPQTTQQSLSDSMQRGALNRMFTSFKKNEYDKQNIKDLNELLEEKTNNHLLDSSPVLTAETILQVKHSYEGFILDTEKEKNPLFELPDVYFNEVFKDISIRNINDLLSLLIFLPSERYDELWGTIHYIEHRNNLLQFLNDYVNDSLLTEEQNLALAKAICKYHQRGSDKENNLYFLSSYTNHPEYFTEALNAFSEDAYTILSRDISTTDTLHRISVNPVFLKLYLMFFPANEALVKIKEKDRNNNTLLHRVAANPAALKLILDFYPEEERLAAVKKLDEVNQSVLFCASSNLESFKTILNLYPAEEQFTAVSARNKTGITPLYKATESNSELLQFILDIYSEEERFAAVTAMQGRKSPLFLAAETSPERLQIIMDALPEADRLDAVMTTDAEGNTLFQWAAKNNHAVFKLLLDRLPEDKLVTILNIKDKDGNKPVHLIASNHELLKRILTLYPQESRLAEVKATNNNGSSLLHWAAENPESLKMLLKLYPNDEARISALKISNKSGNTVLHNAAENPEAFKMLWTLYPEHEQRAALKVTNGGQESLLHLLTHDAQSLKMVLQRYPEAELFAALTAKDYRGNSVLHNAVSNPESLQIILAFLPKETRLKTVLTETGRSYNNTAMHYAAFSSIKAVRVILDSLQPEEQLTALRSLVGEQRTALSLIAHHHQDELLNIMDYLSPEAKSSVLQSPAEEKHTVLHGVASNPELLKIILGLLPKDQHYAFIRRQSFNGNTVLHEAAKHPESLKLLLPLIPKAEQSLCINTKNIRELNTVLHLAVSNPESLKLLLDAIPPEERFAALNQRNKHGQSPLSMIARYHHKEVLTVVMDALTPEERLLAFNTKVDDDLLIHKVITDHRLLKDMLVYLPLTNRADVFAQLNHLGETSIHWAARNNVESFKVMIHSLSPEQRLDFLNIRSEHGGSILHDAVNFPEALQVMMELYPYGTLLEELKVKDQMGPGYTPLASASTLSKIGSFKILLAYLPDDDARFQALLKINPYLLKRVLEDDKLMDECEELFSTPVFHLFRTLLPPLLETSNFRSTFFTPKRTNTQQQRELMYNLVNGENTVQSIHDHIQNYLLGTTVESAVSLFR